jgi:hypothetical protein
MKQSSLREWTMRAVFGALLGLLFVGGMHLWGDGRSFTQDVAAFLFIAVFATFATSPLRFFGLRREEPATRRDEGDS